MTTTLKRAEGGASEARAADARSSISPPSASPCYSCGKLAAVLVRDHLYCGRCAYLVAGDTVGTIAALLMGLGPGRNFQSNASISQVVG